MHSDTKHFKEIKKRLLYWMFFWCFCSIFVYALQDSLLQLVLAPLKRILPREGMVITTHVTEGFMIRIKLIIGGGCIASLPFAFYQLWRFMIPGLYREEKLFWRMILVFSLALFVSGVILAHMLILPLALEFLKGFAGSSIGVEFLPSLSAYLGFYSNLIFAFGISFELPVILLLLGKMGLITSHSLENTRRIAIVSIFIVAAIVTPPDILSQVALALPLLGFYEIVIQILKRLEKSSAQANLQATALE